MSQVRSDANLWVYGDVEMEAREDCKFSSLTFIGEDPRDRADLYFHNAPGLAGRIKATIEAYRAERAAEARKETTP